MSEHPEVIGPDSVEGHKMTKFFNKISGQPASYVNKTDYVFGKTLGAGSFGVVRQARRISTGENVAVKILLKKALKGNCVQIEMLYDELSILQKLHHPNIVDFKAWFESKDKFYIATQLATGGELFDRILARGKFTEVDAVRIIVQLLQGIKYIHSKDIVHRDLKPENVLYIDKSDDSPLVIADFGIAKQLKSGDDLIFKAAGSLGYVAPEVLTVNGHGKPCDIWSLGVITYTLLCGYSPFIAESVEGFLDECTSGKYPVKFHRPYWDTISDEAKEFILRALILEPSKRPTASELLEDPWIATKCALQNDLLPDLRQGFDARKKFREAVEIVKLNNRINKLRSLYCSEGESETDIEENSTKTFMESLTDSLNDLKLRADKSSQNPKLSDEEKKELKSTLTQNAFAQIVRAATKNKEKILNYNEEDNTD
ncbi:hypothetical protein Kpol_1069p13 [Vanderwaltozyma polyspora DSM 70294]|uniref:calcium/calmodulin-dependent protein kinase n=1 Tax=Vanderwaltozyma polyspora (strain ATCC 22028 / DSM 70294 / BCRC 21397 / CBS 2163 / NBRC 10782 / NRRL Y-8283 / UCD 57-17) TaxID=436907 RepID=A7TRC2_VANPO|nr:uncharacterized protein Kpol_1069p13 [Vanderwaltozyma polyspora DSM 70294]EDO15190.1 hypothetical protein Kpol_1069p13 [Vanderwaltozyma polyspora DSM 70294]